MKKLNFVIFILLLILCRNASNAQEVTNEPKNISIGVHVPESGNGIPSNCISMLSNRLIQAITLNGIGSTNSRFVIIPTTSILSTETTSTAPTQNVCKIEVTIALVDVVEKSILTQCTLPLIGVDDTPDKSINQAFSKINARSPELKRLITQGKDKIINYYTNNCDKILSKAETLYKCKSYESALTLTTNVPDFCTDCTIKAKDLTLVIFKEYENDVCQQLLQFAKSEFAQQNFKSALTYLSLINKSTSCFEEANTLILEIAKSHKEFTDKMFDFQKENTERKFELIKALINRGNNESINYNWYLNK